jgi:phage shock protein E
MDKRWIKGDAINPTQNPVMISRRTSLPGLVALGLVISAITGIAEPGSPEHSAAGVQHVNPKQAQKLIQEKKVVILDIRTPGEFTTGRIAGAKNIDFQAPDFEQQIERLDKSRSYLIHCASGGRSTHSLLLFDKHHFHSIYHLDGGIKAWQKSGLPVEK